MSTNVALTVWSPNNGTSEYSVGTAALLVDPASITSSLVDPASITSLIADTGITLTDEPLTSWNEDDSL